MKTRINMNIKGFMEEAERLELSKEDILEIKNSITVDLTRGGMKGVKVSVKLEYVEDAANE